MPVVKWVFLCRKLSLLQCSTHMFLLLLEGFGPVSIWWAHAHINLRLVSKQIPWGFHLIFIVILINPRLEHQPDYWVSICKYSDHSLRCSIKFYPKALGSGLFGTKRVSFLQIMPNVKNLEYSFLVVLGHGHYFVGCRDKLVLSLTI